MNYREFGKDGIKVSEIGLGCWQIGGNWGEVKESEARAILEASIETGVNFLDTADVYGGGRSEKIIGAYLKERKQDDVFVATKVGRMGLYPDKYSEAAIREHVEASLRRLQVEALDLVQTHCVPTEVMRSGEIYEWLERLRDEGKIRRYGASVETMEEANLLIDQAPGVYSLQIIFNIFRQKPIDTLFEKAKAKRVGIIVRVPLASGILSGKFTAATSFGREDHRNFNKDGQAFNVGETFSGIPFEQAVDLAEALKTFKPEGMSLAQMAMRWILDHPAVSSVITGASRPGQVAENASVSALEPLPESLHQALSDFYFDQVREHIRGPL